MAEEIELTDAEQARVFAAADAAEALEVRRIIAERDRLPHVHVVKHEREAIDPDAKGKPTGFRNRLDTCPDCGRSLLGGYVGRVPVLFCASLFGASLTGLTLTAKATAHDVIACGLTPEGVPNHG